MSQSSFPWNGAGLGDHGPYSHTQWSRAWKQFFTLDPAREGVLPGSGGMLAASFPTGLTVRIAPGSALVDGTFYENTSSLDFDLSVPPQGSSRWDRIVLRKSVENQTVRLALLKGTDASNPAVPPLTQVAGGTWEIPVVRALVTSAGSLTLTDERVFTRHAVSAVLKRQGGSPSAWNSPGTNNYTPPKAALQAGAASISLASASSGQVSVTFGAAFESAPLVLVTGSNPNYIAAVQSAGANGAVLEIRHRDGASADATVDLHWLAVGEPDEG